MKDRDQSEQDLIARLLAKRDFVEARRAHPAIVFPAPPDPKLSEAAFMGFLVELLEACGWWVHHETDSRRTHPGFPDLWAVRPPRLLVIETKTAKGAPDLPQLWWMEDLLRCRGGGVEYHLFTPSAADWPRIVMTIAPPNTIFEPHATVAYLTRHDR
jgi:hypothetical protein